MSVGVLDKFALAAKPSAVEKILRLTADMPHGPDGKFNAEGGADGHSLTGGSAGRGAAAGAGGFKVGDRVHHAGHEGPYDEHYGTVTHVTKSKVTVDVHDTFGHTGTRIFYPAEIEHVAPGEDFKAAKATTSSKFKNSGELSSEETSAVSSYTGSGFIEINQELRAGGSGYQDEISNIDSAIAKSSTARGMTVYRGVDAEALSGLKAGDTFTDHGFVSTTTDKALARDTFAGPGDALVHISLPKGTSALDLSAGGEGEVLLPRGSQFLVSSVSSSPGREGTAAQSVYKVSYVGGGK